MRHSARLHAGFMLPVAIFILVLVASISAYLLRFTANAQQTAAFDALGARVYQAARLGMEVALYQANIAGVCNASTTVTAPPGLADISISFTCTASSPFSEWGTTQYVWLLVATASIGTVGYPGYVERQIQASVVH